MKMKVVLLNLWVALLGLSSVYGQTAGTPSAGDPGAASVATNTVTPPTPPGQTPPPAIPAQHDGSPGAAGTNNSQAFGAQSSTNAAGDRVAAQGQGAPIIAVPSNPGEIQKDQALNPTDASLLQQIRKSVFPPGQAGAGSVHFVLMNGAVRLTGAVPNAAEQKRIEMAISQVPGVTKVYDALSVPGQGTEAPSQLTATNAVVSGAGTTNPPNTAPLPPTGFPTGAGPTNAPPRVP